MRAGERWQGYPPAGLTATVRRTGRTARVDDYRDVPGGEPYLREGLRSAVALPVHVNGRLWGMIAVGSGHGPLPPGTEQRMSEFTSLVATAVANAQNRAELITFRARIVAASDEARRPSSETCTTAHSNASSPWPCGCARRRRPLDSDETGTEIRDVAAERARAQ